MAPPVAVHHLLWGSSLGLSMPRTTSVKGPTHEPLHLQALLEVSRSPEPYPGCPYSLVPMHLV